MTNIQRSSGNYGIFPGHSVIPKKAERIIQTISGLSITVQNGTTTINGGRGIEKIHAHQNPDGSWDVNIDGERYEFSAKEARDLVINGGDGDDIITVTGQQLYGPKTKISLNGGNGNDIIINATHNGYIGGGCGIGGWLHEHLQPFLVNEVELEDPGLTNNHNSLNENANQGDNITYQDINGEVFVDGAELTDVQQGRVGDCYFVAALASLALHNPGHLERMITDNGNGTYTVHFRGKLGDVTVDDDFAAVNSGKPVYAHTGSASKSELWVAIIEKAFAQAHGSYAAIEGGHPNEALGEITGQTEFNIGNPAKFSPEVLKSSLANGQSVTASSLSSNHGKKRETAFGIVTSHAYVVTEVSQNAKGKWIVTVYNPWGDDKIGAGAITGADDGFIEMTYDEFVANFRQVQVSQEPIGRVMKKVSGALLKSAE
ncbi:MAG: C2 family cysteine protease [Candidatus Thiodiazotropha sp.]